LTDWSVIPYSTTRVTPQQGGIEMQQVPPPEAPFADKMAYYRTQHTSKGVRAAHLVGTPVIAAGLPLLVVRPGIGAPMFLGGWTLQILGHRLFEKNLPFTHKGWISYQLTGVIHVCEQYGEMLARRSQRKAGRR
jgi:hypothetical protein